MARSLRFYSEFKAACLALQLGVIGPQRRDKSRWEKPTISVVKVNCDSLVRGNGFVGIGFVVHDNSSKVLGAGIDRIQGNFEVECAEVMTHFGFLCILGGQKLL